MTDYFLRKTMNALPNIEIRAYKFDNTGHDTILVTRGHDEHHTTTLKQLLGKYKTIINLHLFYRLRLAE